MKYVRLFAGTQEIELVDLDIDPDYVAALSPNKRALLLPLVLDPEPTPTETQVLEPGPIVVEETQARRTWSLRDKTADELRITVTPRQIRQALNAAGLRQQIEAGVAGADQDTRDWWEFSTAVESDHPAVLSMCAALGITEEQRNQVFGLAATL